MHFKLKKGGKSADWAFIIIYRNRIPFGQWQHFVVEDRLEQRGFEQEVPLSRS